MKFGLMYEIQIPEPHHPGIEQERYKQVLAQVELADEVGFDYFWTVEHHFLTEFSHCLGAGGALRGHLAAHQAHPNRPRRCFAAGPIQPSGAGGRAGGGAGYPERRAHGPGHRKVHDPHRDGRLSGQPGGDQVPVGRGPLHDTENVDRGPLLHEGHYYQIPPRSVIPKPVQKPHPPLWVACAQPDSFKSAGEMGLGVLCFTLGGYEQMEERVAMYRQGLKNAVPVGHFVNDQVAALCVVHCGEDDEEARRVGGPEGAWFVDMATELYKPWQGRDVPESYRFAVSEIEEDRANKTTEDHLQSGAFAMGNPDTVIKVFKKYQEAGVDQILCFMQMGNLAHSRIMDSIKLMGRYVIPYFQ